MMAVERWPGVDGARTACDIVAGAWRAASDAEVVALAVGDGGPRSADAFDGVRSAVGGAEMVATDAGHVLAPVAPHARWSPIDLSAALLGLAAAGEAEGAVIVPLGDETPAGDAADLWGEALPATRQALAGLSMRALVTTDRPLLGFHGMSAQLREGRESDQAIAIAAQEQEDRWRRIAATGDAVASRGTLLGPGRLSDTAGSGAAGGLAYCLAAMGATITRGVDYLADVVGLREAVVGADVVVAVSPRLTPASLDHGVASTVARLAARHAVPAIAIVPEVAVGRRDIMAAGLSATHEGDFGGDGLVKAAGRAARTWAPRR